MDQHDSLSTTQTITFFPPTKSAAKRPAEPWPVDEVLTLFELPFIDLVFRAQEVHRRHFPKADVQLSTLLSVKTGGCEEDCGYCSQSAHHKTGVKATKLMEANEVLAIAKAAKANGATRFCMAAAWRSPKERVITKVEDLIRQVKDLGMETCVTLGMLDASQAQRLKQAGLDYYNHNLDTAPDYYDHIITTRTYQDRLDTLGHVRDAGLKVCCGGIIGMGESRRHRAALIAQLANLNPYPESVPINNLVQVPGTPLHGVDPIDPFEFIRTIAVARITMPESRVRLSAGRLALNDEAQALCFMAGANSIFVGDTLLTTPNPEESDDLALLEKLGIEATSF